MRLVFILIALSAFCFPQAHEHITAEETKPFLVVLGTMQDGGSPHIGCKKACCSELFKNPDPDRKVVCMGLVDPLEGKQFLIEATPDMPSQLKLLKSFSQLDKETPDGVFLSHAHIGHYTGLMYFGKEAMNSSPVPVYAMPRMADFLKTNGPWSQLTKLNNIEIRTVAADEEIQLSRQLKIRPVLVPHRDEFSETVGFVISGPEKAVLFIPDIDKWEKWNRDIVEEIRQVDYAYLDGTFYHGEEINMRDISQIPHPFIEESVKKFARLPEFEKSKIRFIHFNHTNPVLDDKSSAQANVQEWGYKLARFKETIEL